MRRAFTLIELLIVVAIVMILSASLTFSSTQILTRARVTERTHQLEKEVAVTLDAIAGDLAVANAHAAPDPATLSLTLPRTREGASRSVRYHIGSDGLTRHMTIGDQTFQQTLLSETVSAEFTAEPGGLRLSLSAGFSRWRRDIVREVEVFLAWPEVIGIRSPEPSA